MHCPEYWLQEENDIELLEIPKRDAVSLTSKSKGHWTTKAPFPFFTKKGIFIPLKVKTNVVIACSVLFATATHLQKQKKKQKQNKIKKTKKKKRITKKKKEKKKKKENKGKNINYSSFYFIEVNF